MNILTALDPSKPHRELLSFVKKLCPGTISKLYLLYVAPFPEKMVQETRNLSGKAPDKLIGVAEELEARTTQLEQLIEDFQTPDFKVEKLIAGGEIVEVILAKSKELNVDMVVLERHPHHFISYVLGGNTALTIARRSLVPVLLYPA